MMNTKMKPHTSTATQLPWGRSLVILLHGTMLLGLMLVASQVSALEFNQVQTNESTIAFGYTQMGVPSEGKFSKFSAQVSFDPARLAKAQAKIDIDVASIDTGSDEANEEVAGKLWFNASAFPTAGFVSSGIKALGDNRYQATGTLTIKGKTQDVTVPVTFLTTGKRAVLEGAFVIKRLDYGIGEGEWTDVDTVADEIQIKFHLVVNASTGKKK
jgi:polyisoprenoid-binding protein YceI